jgi:DNA-binding NarL/FixJ family response regulator
VPTATTLDLGRTAYDARAWADAYARLSDADSESALEPADVERLATAAYLIGLDDESSALWQRAHSEHLAAGDAEAAARCAFWVAFRLFIANEPERGGGWIARARRILDEAGLDSVVRGYLMVPTARRTVLGGDAEGGELLDEVMVALTSDEVMPLVVGDIYCSVIQGCRESFDLRRAQAWTQSLTRWCDAQPDLVPYRGQCLLHRAEIMALHGAWEDALAEVGRARDGLAARPGLTSVGEAYSQQADLHRLRGDHAAAEDDYREASRLGYEPQPGLALLRLAQGQVPAAAAAIRRVLDEAQDPSSRARLLPGYVEIMLADGDLAAAREGADELGRLAAELEAPLLRAFASSAQGAILLAERDPRAALAMLRRAWTAWQELSAPHEAACVRALIGLACRELGDDDAGAMELDAARWAFEELGAAPDVARIEALVRPRGSGAAGGLTARELEVLRLVAAGKTNRAIAEDLVLSEKTIARHVANIFAKLGVSSRAAATAFAYENGLV